jgi:hypothetical protein
VSTFKKQSRKTATFFEIIQNHRAFFQKNDVLFGGENESAACCVTDASSKGQVYHPLVADAYTTAAASAMAVFLNSTHDRCWVFTDSDITNLHARVYSINNSNPAQSSSSSSSSPSSSSSSGRVIDMDTRDFLLQHYTYKMEVALQSFKGISPCVLYSAVTYFRRFYLRRSFYEFAPRMIFATCLYLATKSEEHHVKVVHLHRACFPNTTQQTPQVMTHHIHTHICIHTHAYLFV